MGGSSSFTLQRPTGVRWLIFLLACATSWLLYLHRYAWGVVKLNFKAEHPHLNNQTLGWLDSSFLAAYTIGQIPGGLAGDLLGARLMLGLLILLWSLLVACIGGVHQFWWMVLVLALFGLAQAGAYPILSKVTRNWFPLSVRTGVQGGVTALGRAGGACASVVVAALLISRLGLSWREALVVIALPGVGLAVLFWLVFRNRPGEHPWSNAAEADLIGGKETLPGLASAATRNTHHWLAQRGFPSVVALEQGCSSNDSRSIDPRNLCHWTWQQWGQKPAKPDSGP